jgi:Lanthionine synthetase C-like protein/Protein kinase domain
MIDGDVRGPARTDAVWRLLRAHMPWVTDDGVFSTHYYAAGRSPDQGWKVHVSATPWSAKTVLERCLPTLLDFGVACKVASTSLQLLLLNNGCYGASQVGKFITVYPPDDEAVAIAAELHRVTVGLAGPRIPSDRRLRPDSLVHYRYGAFRGLPGRPNGEVQDAVGSLRDQLGRRVPDVRELPTEPPIPDLSDPFAAAGLHVAAIPRPAPLAGRFLVVDVLATTAYGGVYRALDLDGSNPRVCVVKEFWRDAGGDFQGRLAPDWGHQEADLLRRHHSDPAFPAYLAEFELDGNRFVAAEYVPGQSMAEEIAIREDRLDGFTLEEAVTLGRATAQALQHVHHVGVLMRDVNPSNIILTPHDGCRLVDFGIAHDRAISNGPASGLGTADFCSPQQWDGEPPQIADDVFSWGAVMHALLCGTRGLEESRQAAGSRLGRPVRRLPVRELNPSVPIELASIVDRACAWNAAARMSCFDEILLALASPMASTGSEPLVACAVHPSDGGDPLALATGIGNALCDAAIARDGGNCWPTHGNGSRFCSPDLYHGAAGIGLFLAELGRRTGEERFTDTARAAARWLAGPAWADGRGEPGLYCGESGVGWFLIRLATLLNEPAYLNAAELRARRIKGTWAETMELLTGHAGHVVFLSRLAQATGKASYIEDALAIGGRLAAISWKRRDVSLGLAHGAAGVGFALLELGRAAKDPRMISAATTIADLLLTQAKPHPDGGSQWPETFAGTRMRVQAQCHGAIGIGQFLLRLSRTQDDPRYSRAAAEAAKTARNEMISRPSHALCHGVAGDGVFLLECSQLLNDAPYEDWAHEAGSHLSRFRSQSHDGRYVSAPWMPARPDLLTGDAGVGWFYLALANPHDAADPVLSSPTDSMRGSGAP